MVRFNGIAGIFIGGLATRLGGIPKGLLKPPGAEKTLVADIAHKLERVGVGQIVLVGTHLAYKDFPFVQIADAQSGLGPMAGLMSLVNHTLAQSHKFALAIACDMPYLSERLLSEICTRDESAVALVPKREKREPLCARYNAREVAPHLASCLSERRLSLMSLLDSLGAGCVELSVDNDSARALVDWDEPGDLE